MRVLQVIVNLLNVIVNLVYQAAVSVLNVTAPNTHTMPTSSLIFQLLGNKLTMCLKCVFSSSNVSFLRQRYYQALQW